MRRVNVLSVNKQPTFALSQRLFTTTQRFASDEHHDDHHHEKIDPRGHTPLNMRAHAVFASFILLAVVSSLGGKKKETPQQEEEQKH